MINKRAQAALEFLTTYGWAFLVILIMIGALSYFGVFSLENHVPESSNIGTGAVKGGNDFSIAYDSANTESILMLEFINDKDRDIVLDNIIISEASSGVEYVGIPSPTSIPSGFNGVIEVTFDDTVDNSLTSDFVGDKKRFNIEIFYNLVGSSIPAMVEGTITTTVQDVTTCVEDDPRDSSTTCGQGICAGNQGTDICDADGAWIYQNDCDPFDGAVAEDCDTPVDDNCDGEVNENCGSSIPPTVSIVGRTNAIEPDTNGEFTIILSKNAISDVVINYSVTGDAIRSITDCDGTRYADYILVDNFVTIQSGRSEASIPIDVCSDSTVESSESITITLVDDSEDYDLGAPSDDSITISDGLLGGI
jgi:hypothetical protein